MNDLISKIGVDKLLHFFVGAFISFFITMFFILKEGLDNNTIFVFSIIGLGITAIIGFLKEMVIDSVFNILDFIYTIAGGMVPSSIISVYLLYYIIFN